MTFIMKEKTRRDDIIIIQAINVSRNFGNKKAVDSLSLSIRKGEIFGLLGPNGAGKSTLLSMFTTLMLPSKGKIIIDGHNTVSAGKEVRKEIGVVFQDFFLDGSLSVFDNLDIHARLYKMDKDERRKAIAWALRLVGLEEEVSSKVSTLSGGMKKRLDIARGFIASPSILFLDEPSLGLDPVARRAVWKRISYLNKQEGCTVVLATNSMEEAEKLCGRVALMDKGKIIAIKETGELGKPRRTVGSLEDFFIRMIGSKAKYRNKDMKGGLNG